MPQRKTMPRQLIHKRRFPIRQHHIEYCKEHHKKCQHNDQTEGKQNSRNYCQKWKMMLDPCMNGCSETISTKDATTSSTKINAKMAPRRRSTR